MLQMQSIFNHLKLTKRYFVNAVRYAVCVKLEAIKKNTLQNGRITTNLGESSNTEETVQASW